MSLASMKLKLQLSPDGTLLGVVPLEVVAVHHHRDSRELNVHLRPVGNFEAGTVDIVLLGDDLDSALRSLPQVGQHFTLALSAESPVVEAPPAPEEPSEGAPP